MNKLINMSNKQSLTIESLTNTGTTKGTIPTATSAIGSVSSLGVIVTGTGTSFEQKVLVGGYLYAETTHQLGRIKDVYSDTQLFLEEAFKNDIAAGETFKFVDVLYRSISVENSGGGDAGLAGGVIHSGDIKSFNNEWGIDPIKFAASSQTLELTLGY